MGEIEAADGATCDLFWKDMVASGGTGNYSVGHDDFRAIYMGKLEYMEPGKSLVLAESRNYCNIQFLQSTESRQIRFVRN